MGLRICFVLLVLAFACSAADEFGGPYRTFHPMEIEDPLPNPYMGWGLWVGPKGFGNNERNYTVEQNTTGFGGDAPLFNWILVDWDWASIEPKEGQFNWSSFDDVVQYWAARNKNAVVRFWVTDDAGWNGHPGARVLPDWLWAKGLRYREYAGNGGVKQREPDYLDPSYKRLYLPALKNFLTAFAQRYDKQGSPVALLQVMGYGHWADWATWYSHYPFPSLEVKHDLLASIIEVYIETFQHIRLLEFGGPDWDTSKYLKYDGFLRSKGLDVGLRNGFALIWTGFIDGLESSFDWITAEENWRSHPIIAEGNWNYDDMMDQRTHGTLDENLDVALLWHANYTHYYFTVETYLRAMKEQTPVFQRALRSGGLGYRLVPESLSWRESLPAGNLFVVKQTWVNRNVGRLYERHPLKLYLTDEQGNDKFSAVAGSFDETDWIAGQEHPVISVFRLPKELSPGNYDVRIALVGPDGNPRIRLGISGEDSRKRYNIGKVQILPSLAQKVCDTAFCP
ncbi:MAG: DUF4832 domain-containing protein [Bryobacteraceae bacterium]